MFDDVSRSGASDHFVKNAGFVVPAERRFWKAQNTRVSQYSSSNSPNAVATTPAALDK
jgi:hypothetical protein